MSTHMGDVSHIKDEDVLKKMWQNTEDFGLKKEIRTHMYKLREARLRDLYNTEEVSKQQQHHKITSSTTGTSSKNCSTHADSILDHSFLSMKSKEIRDSESPTRDVAYIVSNKGRDHGWNISTSSETSPDGKLHTTSRVALTAGTKPLEGGKLDYSAKAEQKASVYSDGDDRNYVRSVGASTSSVIKQEAAGGDENASFKSSSFQTSKSSKTVTEKHSEDVVGSLKALPASATNKTDTVMTQVYTTDTPNALKNHPSYVDGNTKVTQETRTLPDGSIVTTTRYETTGKHSSQVSNKQQSVSSSTEQKSSTVKSSSASLEQHTTKLSNEDKKNMQNIQKTKITDDIRPISGADRQIIRDTRTNIRNRDDTSKLSSQNVETRSVHTDIAQNISQNVEKYSSQDIRDVRRMIVDDDTCSVKSDRSFVDSPSRNVQKIVNIDVKTSDNTTDVVDQHYENKTRSVHTEKSTNIQKQNLDVVKNVDVNVQKLYHEKYVPQDKETTFTTEKDTVVKRKVTKEPDGSIKTTIITTKQPQQVASQTSTITTKTHNVKEQRDQFVDIERRQEQDNRRVDKEVIIKTTSETSPEHKPQPIANKPQQQTYAPSRVDKPQPHQPSAPVQDTYDTKTHYEVTKTFTCDVPTEYPPSQKYTKPDEPKHDTPERRHPIRPGKSELDEKPRPTEGQYDTTYRTDYTNKKISVEVSPTHDAFARSLRAVSPDRISKCSSPSRSSVRSVKTSSTSLRSSSSPEKMPYDEKHSPRTSPDKYPSRRSPDKHPSRSSPDKYTSRTPDKYPYDRSPSPKKSGKQFLSNETITYRRTSPEKKTEVRRSDVTSAHKIDINVRRTTDTQFTDRKTKIDSSTLTRKKKHRSRSPSPQTVDRTPGIDSTTLTRKKKPYGSRSRSPSPSNVTTDDEYLRNVHEITTDLDENITTVTRKTHHTDAQKQTTTHSTFRPTSLDVTSTKKSTRKVTERSPSSPLTDDIERSPTKESPRKTTPKSPTGKVASSPTGKPRQKSPMKVDSPVRDAPENKPFRRRDTYEERCRQILGISEKTDTRRDSLEKISTTKRGSITKETKSRPSKSPEKQFKPSKPVEDDDTPLRKSPEKSILKSPIKDTPKKVESPEKSQLKSPTRGISEFPSQIRKSPEKQPKESYPAKPTSRKTPDSTGISEFPSQIRKSPEKQPREPYPEKSPTRKMPNDTMISEFPAQVRRSPEKETCEPYTEKARPKKISPDTTGYPSQSRKSPEKHILDKEITDNVTITKQLATKQTEEDKYNINVCTKAQITTAVDTEDINYDKNVVRSDSPEKIYLEDDDLHLSQRITEETYVTDNYGRTGIHKTHPENIEYPERQPDRQHPQKESKPSVQEFPSQIRKSPEKEPLEEYPEKKKSSKIPPQLSEFPSQVRKSPEKEVFEKYPEKQKPTRETPQLSEFPSQTGKSSIKKQPTISVTTCEARTEENDEVSEKNRVIVDEAHQNKVVINEYTEENYHKKPKDAPSIPGYPSQLKRSPEKEPSERYPEENKPKDEAPSINEYPAQIRKSPEKETLEKFPEKLKPKEKAPSISEFPSQVKKTPDKQPLEKYPEKQKPQKEGPSISEFPSQKKIPDKQPCEKYPEQEKPYRETPTVGSYASQIKSPEKEPLEKHQGKVKPKKEAPLVPKHPSQISESPKEKHPRDIPTTITKDVPKKEKPRKDNPENIKPKQDKPRKHRRSSSSSSSSSSSAGEEIEENKTEQIITKDELTFSESQVPVNEPVATKKVISYLCREDEIDKTTVLDKNETQKFLEQEILNEKSILNKTVKKDSPERTLPKKRPVESFIEHERIDSTTTVNKDSPTQKSPVKKPDQKTATTNITTKKIVTDNVTKEVRKDFTKDKPSQKKMTDTYKTVKTEYVSEYCKPKPKDASPKTSTKTTERITLYDVDNFDKVDNTVHIRTHRIDDTINVKTNKIIQNGHAPKKYITTKIKDIPEQKRGSPKTDGPTQKPVTKAPVDRKPDTVIKRPTGGFQKKTQKPDDTILHTTAKKTTIAKTQLTNGFDKPRPNKPQEKEIPKRHVVSTTITITPKTKATTKVGPVMTTKTTKTKEIIQKTPVKQQNGHAPSDSETSISESFENIYIKSTTISATTKDKTTKKADTKITRTTSDRIIKTQPQKTTTTRGHSKPELLTPSRDKPQEKTKPREKSPEKHQQKPKQEKCITTKSIIINNELNTEKEVIVNLQRSQSSREPTPDRICPLPVTSDEEDNVPRYPDKIMEPEDGTYKKPKRLSDIPILENEDSVDFTRITEIRDTKTNQDARTTDIKETRRITEVDKVEETDESLLSVNKKISKFLDTAEQLTKKPVDSRGRAPKVERPKLVVDDDLRTDECLLSVSDKVSKFISTAEQLTTPQYPDRPKSPKCQNYPELDDKKPSGIKDKVSHFVTLTEKTTKTLKSDHDVPDNKASKPVSLSKLDEPLKRQPAKKPSQSVPSECVQIEKEEHFYTRKSLSPDKQSPRRSVSPKPEEQKTPDRKPPNTYDSIKQRDSHESKYHRRSSSPKSPDSTPKSTRRPSEEEPKHVLSETTRLRSTESIKKAKALFENVNTEQEVLKQRDILSRPSVFEGRKPKPDSKPELTKTKLDFDHRPTARTGEPSKNVINKPDHLKSTKLVLERYRPNAPKPIKTPSREISPERDEDVPHYMRPREKDCRPHSPSIRVSPNQEAIPFKPYSRDLSPERYEDVPHYMKPLDRSPRPESPYRRSPTRDLPSSEPYSRESTPDRNGDVPHYMKPLDRSLRPHSPHKPRVDEINRMTSPTRDEVTTSTTTKFGVTLRRTDSGRFGTPTASVPSDNLVDKRTDTKQSEVTLERNLSDVEIEEIFELKTLEYLLETTTSYEIRRRIRTQIRLVKKLISENRLTTYISTRRTQITTRDAPKRATSPTKTKPLEPKTTSIKTTTEYQDKFTRKPSPERKIVDNKLYQHTDLIDKKDRSEKITEYTSSFNRYDQKNISLNEKRVLSSSERRNSSEILRRSHSPEEKMYTSKSPERKQLSAQSHTEKKTSSTEVTNALQSSLKKIPQSSKVATEEKPSWVTQRNLKKTAERIMQKAPSTTKPASSSSLSKPNVKKQVTRSSSPCKDVKTTDIITSSYGVGPTDENGEPLFGLKALRAQNNKTDTTTSTKVSGTVIQSHYYAENGSEPVGEVSVTKFSSDPRDLVTDDRQQTDVRRGVTSVTTTQKFGYKDTPTLKSLSGQTKEICDVDNKTKNTKTTSKITRRNSVKALSQKFIENAVETSKSERQSSYPKAGLILRTSSFKDSTTRGGRSSREGSPGDSSGMEENVIVKTSKTTVTGAETFLTSKTKVTGVQDVITRMKTEDVREGDTAEEIEARGLLNKFIGSQVILSGMEGHMSSKTSATATCTSVKKASTKVTTTITEGGKQVTKTRIFQHPVSDEDLETVWDEDTFKLLLENSTDYEERRRIRAKLRQIMAEQEACTELVDKTSQEQTSSGKLEGESLLLPLLQGLLDAPENENTADSGTESGEDQRYSLIAEVQNALDKLSASLRGDATDMTPERKSSLLQLVTKLQAGLATSAPSSERRASQGRFNRRKQRQNRHTVGVSREELAHARQLIEEISLGDVLPQEIARNLQKQRSEGSIIQHSGSNSSFKSVTLSNSKSHVKNAVAKPYSSSNSTTHSKSGTPSSGNTPTDPSDPLNFLLIEEPKPDVTNTGYGVKMREKKAIPAYRQSTSYEEKQNYPSNIPKRPLSEHMTSNVLYRPQVSQETYFNGPANNRKVDVAESTQSSETDDDPSTLKGQQPDLIMQSNLIYNPPGSKPLTHEEKCNKFNTKKLKMKRANTIDIPKPLNFYQDDEETDTETEEDYQQRRRSNYLALRGPIRVGNPNPKSIVPALDPKTESDKKFLAFINKHNENNVNKGSLWSNPNNRGSVWSNKFGKIQRNFEKASNEPKTPGSQSSAMQFWKATDDSITTSGSGSRIGPKISKQNARNLQQMFEEKQRQSKVDYYGDEGNIVTGSLKVNTKPRDQEKVCKFVPQPLPVNKFSHAPQSAFQPIPKKFQPIINKPDVLNLSKGVLKTEIKEQNHNNDQPLYLYSPKSLQDDSNSSSPISLKPWAASSNEHRVLSIAASKFENPQPQPVHAPHRRASKDKIVIPANLQCKNKDTEKLTAPYLIKSVPSKSNTVRKLSDQYDNLKVKSDQGFVAQNTVRYLPAQQENNQVYSPSAYPPQQQNKYAYNKQFSQNYGQQYGGPKYQQNYLQQFNQNQPYVNQNYAPAQQYGNSHQYQQNVGPYGQNTQFPPHDNRDNYNRQYSSNQGQYDQQYIPNERYIQPQNQPYPQYNQNYNIPIQENVQDQQFTSTCQFKPQTLPAQPHVFYNNVAPQAVQDQPHVFYNNTASQKPQTYNVNITTESTFVPQQIKQDVPSKVKVNKKEKHCHPDQLAGPPKLQTQMSNESIHEHTAVSSKVMSGPVSQQAVTIRQKSPMNREGHEMGAALKNSLQKVNNKTEPKSTSPSFKYKQTEETKPVSPRGNFSFTTTEKVNNKNEPKSTSPSSICKQVEETKPVSPRGSFSFATTEKPDPASPRPSSFKYKTKEQQSSQLFVNSSRVQEDTSAKREVTQTGKPIQQQISKPSPATNRPLSSQSLHTNSRGETVLTSKFQIPIINTPKEEVARKPSPAQVLSKSDSWHQICMQAQNLPSKPSPRSSPNNRTVVKSKSSHSLALPKLFEAGMSKDEMQQKKKTMEAFLTGTKSPTNTPGGNESGGKSAKSSIKRIRTSEKTSTYSRQSSGLSRSRTLPDIVCPDLLDESNVDEAFDDLFKSST